jgi:hypothetical protein
MNEAWRGGEELQAVFLSALRGTLKVLNSAKQLLGPNTITQHINSLDSYLNRCRRERRVHGERF